MYICYAVVDAFPFYSVLAWCSLHTLSLKKQKTIVMLFHKNASFFLFDSEILRCVYVAVYMLCCVYVLKRLVQLCKRHVNDSIFHFVTTDTIILYICAVLGYIYIFF